MKTIHRPARLAAAYALSLAAGGGSRSGIAVPPLVRPDEPREPCDGPDRISGSANAVPELRPRARRAVLHRRDAAGGRLLRRGRLGILARRLEVPERTSGRDRGHGLIILDWRMPGMDGIECLRQLALQAHSDTRAPTVLMLTAYDRDEAMRRLAHDGLEVAGVLTKPVTSSTQCMTYLTSPSAPRIGVLTGLQ